MSISLKNQTIAITGAASGIGLACARLLHGEGARIVLIDCNQQALDQACAALGERAHALALDLLDGHAVSRTLLPSILDKVGSLDVLHVNAGSYIGGLVTEGDPDAWERMLNLNVNAAFRCAHAVLPYMVARKTGDVLFTSSIAGVVPVMAEPVYTASKHAIQAFVHSTRRQVAPHGVRVGAVQPGAAVTPLLDDWPADKMREVQAQKDSLMSADDIAEAVHFMLTRPRNITVRDMVIIGSGLDL